MIPSKIYNKKSKRTLLIGGAQYKKLLNSGFTVNKNGELSPPHKPAVVIPPDADIKTIVSVLLPYLSPKDLLALYLSNIEVENELNTVKTINILNERSDTDVKSFTEWYKKSTLAKVNNQLLYLYDLENTRYINEKKIYDIMKGFDVITENFIAIVFDWLYQVRKMFKLPFNVYCYACTLFLIYLSNNELSKEELQIYGLVCLDYASLNLVEYILDIDDYVYISDKAFTEDQFKQAKIKVFKSFNGQLIYPSPIWFVDQTITKGDQASTNDDILVLIGLTSIMLLTSLYKPSLIAETCKYMITGQHTIYTVQEMNPICTEIVKYLKKLLKSSLETFRVRAELVINQIKIQCGDDVVINPLQPLKYNEPWHLGEIETGDVIGKGTYGEVSKIKRLECGTNFVAKATNDEGYINEALNEISLLTLLKNQSNVISLCGYEYLPEKVNMYLPLMSGSLKSVKLDKSKYGIYFKQIIEGVRQCHHHDILHRDLKMENIVYDENTDTLKIIDFGLSVPLQSIKILKDGSLVNTFHYRPPECLITDGYQYGQSVDIWAIGCIMYYMMTDTYVVQWYTHVGAINDIFQLLGTPNDETWPGFSTLKKIEYKNYPGIIDDLKVTLAPYSNMILSCLTLYPPDRPTALQLLEF